jgi:tRNA/tmRNA/rRNA uracil-C5-methylase (TrmA/RlmC/RlmD family)
MVSADGKVVFTADRFLSREDSVVLDPPRKGGSK